MCTQTGVLNALFLTLSLLVLICVVNSKLLQVEVWFSGSQRIIINMSANASNCPLQARQWRRLSWTKAMARTVVKNMVASNAATSDWWELSVHLLSYIHGYVQTNWFCQLVWQSLCHFLLWNLNICDQLWEKDTVFPFQCFYLVRSTIKLITASRNYVSLWSCNYVAVIMTSKKY